MSHNDPYVSPTIDSKNWTTTEVVQEYAGSVEYILFHWLIPSSYLFKRKLVPKESSSDPVANYYAFDEEMVLLAPIIAAHATNEESLFVDAVIADRKSTWGLRLMQRDLAYHAMGVQHSSASFITTLDQIM